MGKDKYKTRNIDHLVKLDVYDDKGNIIERWKSLISNKRIGRRILLRIKELFGLTNRDLSDEEERLYQEDLRTQKELVKKV